MQPTDSPTVNARFFSDEAFSGSPASLQQQRFWLLDRLFPGNPAYNIAVRWKLSGKLNPAILESAINEVLRRHEVLRTRFELQDERPVQIVEKHLSINLPVFDLRRFSGPERQAEEERLTVAEARRSFDLTTLPLIRASLLRLGEEDYTLLMTMHHIVSDGWSIGVIVDEFAANYQALASGTQPALAPLPLSYSDYVAKQNESLDSEEDQQAIEYWTRKLENLPRCDVRTDHARPPIQTSNGHIVSVLLSRELTNRLAALSSQRGATLFMTAYAALCAALQLWTSSSDIVMGTSVTGRNTFESEPLIGVFTNVLVLRTDLSGDPGFNDLLKRARQTIIDALRHQDVAFERLVEILNPRRDLSTSPLFSINFIFQRSFIKNQTFAGISLTDIPSRSPGSLYDLNFFMVERPDGWRASCEYNTDLFETATVEKMLSQFEAVLGAIARDPEQRISKLLSFAAQKDATPGTSQATTASETPSFGPPGHAMSRAVLEPRNETQARLVELWTEALGIAQIGIDENLFDLGATSLKAASMVARISRAFGEPVSLMTLFRFPTIEEFARTLKHSQNAASHSRVVALQPVGTRAPFWFLESEPRFLKLQKNFGPYFAPECPVLSPVADDTLAHARPYDLCKNAAYHVETILSAQPRGPYYLGGYSAGGIMAFEIAQQLWARGHEVGLLVLFDTANPRFMGEHSSVERFKARHLARWTAMRELRLGQLPRFFYEKVAARFASIGVAARRLLYKMHLIGGMRPDDPPVDLFWERRAAAQYYEPMPYPGRLLLFRRTQYLSGRYMDPTFGWGDLVQGGLEICSIPTGHMDLFDGDNIGPIAKTLRDRLYKRHSETTGSSEREPSTAPRMLQLSP